MAVAVTTTSRCHDNTCESGGWIPIGQRPPPKLLVKAYKLGFSQGRDDYRANLYDINYCYRIWPSDQDMFSECNAGYDKGNGDVLAVIVATGHSISSESATAIRQTPAFTLGLNAGSSQDCYEKYGTVSRNSAICESGYIQGQVVNSKKIG